MRNRLTLWCRDVIIYCSEIRLFSILTAIVLLYLVLAVLWRRLLRKSRRDHQFGESMLSQRGPQLVKIKLIWEPKLAAWQIEWEIFFAEPVATWHCSKQREEERRHHNIVKTDDVGRSVRARSDFCCWVQKKWLNLGKNIETVVTLTKVSHPTYFSSVVCCCGFGLSCGFVCWCQAKLMSRPRPTRWKRKSKQRSTTSLRCSAL